MGVYVSKEREGASKLSGTPMIALQDADFVNFPTQAILVSTLFEEDDEEDGPLLYLDTF